MNLGKTRIANCMLHTVGGYVWMSLDKNQPGSRAMLRSPLLRNDQQYCLSFCYQAVPGQGFLNAKANMSGTYQLLWTGGQGVFTGGKIYNYCSVQNLLSITVGSSAQCNQKSFSRVFLATIFARQTISYVQFGCGYSTPPRPYYFLKPSYTLGNIWLVGSFACYISQL